MNTQSHAVPETTAHWAADGGLLVCDASRRPPVPRREGSCPPKPQASRIRSRRRAAAVRLGHLPVWLCGSRCGLPRRVRAGCQLLPGVFGLEEDPVGHDGVDILVRAFDHQLSTELAVLDGDHRVADVLL